MKGKLPSRLLRTAQGSGMLPAGSRVGVAVSGGADSVALLFLLHEMRCELAVTLRVLHLNHQLRGADADADEALVQSVSARLGLECIAESTDVRAVAQEKGWNLEDAARRLRRQFFEKVVSQGLADRVAVAHTADDQAETVLMHLLRGTGITGLAGIHPVAGVVVRPLLDVRRAELREYLQTRGETWREDATNQDSSRMRARIRRELLPLLVHDFQPAAVERLGSLARLALEERDLWNRVLGPVLDAVVQQGEWSGHGCKIHIADIQYPFRARPTAPGIQPASSGDAAGAGAKAPVALQKRIIRGLIEKVRGNLRGITARHIDQVLSLAEADRGGGETHLPGLRVRRDLGLQLSFAARPVETTGPASPYLREVALPLGGEQVIAIPESGISLRLKRFDCTEQGRDTNTGAETLDPDLLREPLVLRNWRPGDSYRPRGRSQPHKLKRLFWEQGIPAPDRALWPVLLSGDAIVWVRSFGVAAEFAASAQSRTGVWVIEDEL